jgi:hypothetical protein
MLLFILLPFQATVLNKLCPKTEMPKTGREKREMKEIHDMKFLESI